MSIWADEIPSDDEEEDDEEEEVVEAEGEINSLNVICRS